MLGQHKAGAANCTLAEVALCCPILRSLPRV